MAEYIEHIKLTKEYYEECFEQSYLYASKIRKIEYGVAILFFISGIGLFIYANGQSLMPLALIAIALFELSNSYIKKIWWVKKQMNSKLANSQINLTFNNLGLNSVSPTSESKITWDGIERMLETPKGILIWPQKGIHIYLPKSHISKDTIYFIISKQQSS